MILVHPQARDRITREGPRRAADPLLDHRPVLLAYLDESYSDNHYFIGALVVAERAARPLVADLDDLMTRTSARFAGIDPSIELHAHELVNAKGGWRPLARMLPTGLIRSR